MSPVALRRLLALFAFGLITVLAGIWGYYTLFSVFAPYDDEGYLLLARGMVWERGGLYDEVYAQHGPFYFLYYGVLHGLGVPLTHAATRWATLAHWLMASGLCAWFAFRLTRSAAASVLVFLFSARHLQAVFYSAGHPQEVLAMLTAGAGLALTFLDGGRGGRVAAAVLGGIVAAAVLTKINVGGFLAIAAGVAVLWAGVAVLWAGVAVLWAGQRRWEKAGYWALGMAGVVAPVVLMRAEVLDVSSTLVYGVSIAAGVGLAIWAGGWKHEVQRGKYEERHSHRFAQMGIGFVGVAAVVVIVTMIRGTSLEGLVEGVVLGPLRFVEGYSRGREMSVWLLAASVVSMGMAVVWKWVARRGEDADDVLEADDVLGVGDVPGARPLIVQMLRVGFGALVGWIVVMGPAEWLVAVVAPFSWVVLIGTRNGARVFLAVGMPLLALQAYPWAGSQLYVGTMLAIPWAAVVLMDAATMWMERAAWLAGERGKALRGWRWRTAAALVAAVAAGYWLFGRDLPVLKREYEAAAPLGLPGTAGIRPAYSILEGALPAREIVSTLNWVVNNVEAHGDTFVTLPGLYSFHVWSGIAPPNGLNAGQWMTLFDDEQQQRVLRDLAAHERTCVVYNPTLLEFWTGPEAAAHGPLARHLMSAYRPLYRVGSYYLMFPAESDPQELYNALLTGTRRIDARHDLLPLPTGILSAPDAMTLVFEFRTEQAGVLLGAQKETGEGVPAVYVDLDGNLRGQLPTGTVSPVLGPRVDDGERHVVVVTTSGREQTWYIDGVEAGRIPGEVLLHEYRYGQFGGGHTAGWPETGPGMAVMRGEICDARMYPTVLSAEEVAGLAAEK